MACFSLGSSIPVLRMLDETKTKAFYLEYLGYSIDWEHRFRETSESPLYMQVHHGDSVLHLNGHAEADTPVCEVRIPVNGLAEYCEFLASKESEWESPVMVDPRYDGRPTEVNLIDPSGNHVVLWRPTWKASE